MHFSSLISNSQDTQSPWKILTNILLITLLAFPASGIVSAKVASGPQNLSGVVHQGETVFKPLMHQGKTESSYGGMSGSSVVAKGIKTPYGVASQGTDVASLAARGQVENGTTLYRIGTTGKSQAAEAQFWSLESPLSKGYAQKYGIPADNVTNANFVETATLKPGTSFVTRPAPGVGANTGGGIEVVVPQSGVKMRAFNYGGNK